MNTQIKKCRLAFAAAIALSCSFAPEAHAQQAPSISSPRSTGSAPTSAAGRQGAGAAAAAVRGGTATTRAPNTPNAPSTQRRNMAPPTNARPYFDNQWMQQIDPMLKRNNVNSLSPQARSIVRSNPVDTTPDEPDNSDRPDRKHGGRYGYRNPARTPFFYDYYSYSPYYYSYPLGAVGAAPYGSYYQYQDLNNDGFYDEYHTYRDRDNDGIPDDYEAYYFQAAAAQAEQRQARIEAREERQEQREEAIAKRQEEGRPVELDGGLRPEDIAAIDGNSAANASESASEGEDQNPVGMRRSVIEGTVADTMISTVNDQEHRILQVRSDQGQTFVVDAGPITTTGLDKISQGGEIGAKGYVETIGDQEVLIAEQLTVSGQAVEINRQGEATTAQILELSVVPTAGTDRTFAVVEAKGDRYLVDFGIQAAEELGLATGDEVGIRAVPIRVGDYRVFMAHEAIIEGRSTPIIR